MSGMTQNYGDDWKNMSHLGASYMVANKSMAQAK